MAAAGWLLFAMVRRDKTSSSRAADQKVRWRLLGLIRRKPGIRLSRMWRAAGVARGTVQYHLNVLERIGLIEPVRQGGESRFYTGTSGAEEAAGIGLLRRGRVGELVELILDNPGWCQQELAKVLGIRRKTFRAYADQLTREQLVEERRDRNKKRYFATPRLVKLAEMVGRDFGEELEDEPEDGGP